MPQHLHSSAVWLAHAIGRGSADRYWGDLQASHQINVAWSPECEGYRCHRSLVGRISDMRHATVHSSSKDSTIADVEANVVTTGATSLPHGPSGR